MNASGGSRDVIGDGIEILQDRHGPFPVNQTTLSLSPAAYDDAVARAEDGVADVYVRVHNDDGDVLHVENDGRPRVPRCVGNSAKPLIERACTIIHESTGIDCKLDEIVRVTIAGVRNAEEPDADTVYRLLVLFDASYQSGTLQNGSWQADPEIPEFV